MPATLQPPSRWSPDIGEHLDLASLADSVPQTEDLLDAAAEAPIVQLINALLSEAIREGASDVHIGDLRKGPPSYASASMA